MGGNRREEGSVMVKNSNVFAALDTLRKKKKSDKEKSKGSSKKEQEPEVLWAPAPLTVKSWADVDDEDDDDYYATTAPLQSFVGSNESGKKTEPVEVLFCSLVLIFFGCLCQGYTSVVDCIFNRLK